MIVEVHTCKMDHVNVYHNASHVKLHCPNEVHNFDSQIQDLSVISMGNFFLYLGIRNIKNQTQGDCLACLTGSQG